MDNFRFFKDEVKTSYSDFIRKVNKEKFIAIGFPTSKDDNWIYTSTTSIEKSSFNFSYPINIEEKMNTLFFKNSSFSFGKFGKNITLKLREDISLYENILKNNDRFINLNLSFFNKVVVVEIDNCRDISINLNIEILGNNCSFPFVIFEVKNSSKVNIIENIYSSINSFSSPFINIICGDNCSVEYVKIQNTYGSIVDNTQIFIQKKSLVKFFTLSKGSKILRNNLNVYLQDKDSSVELYSVYNCKDSHIDNNVNVNHLLNDCKSIQLYKGVVRGNSEASFTGKIDVSKDAQNTIASQLNKNIILDQANVNIRPQLKIDADEVKCSHGATIGNLNEDEIFYLESRGIDKELSKKMIINSFFEEVLLNMNGSYLEKFKLFNKELDER